MRADEIRRHLRRQPFQPIRLTLTDGRTYDVRHPELMMLGRSIVIVGIPAPNEVEPVIDRAIDVSLLHVMQVEPLGRSTLPAEPDN